ncbi:MAG TPA: hypothetical protein VFW30_05515 [Bryocella sp.]|nr:hypothetical protein [Bryocella sp.]
MRYVSSLTDILRATLKRMEAKAQLPDGDRHARELRRRLLITIADLEARKHTRDENAPLSMMSMQSTNNSR